MNDAAELKIIAGKVERRGWSREAESIRQIADRMEAREDDIIFTGDCGPDDGIIGCVTFDDGSGEQRRQELWTSVYMAEFSQSEEWDGNKGQRAREAADEALAAFDIKFGGG